MFSYVSWNLNFLFILYVCSHDTSYWDVFSLKKRVKEWTFVTLTSMDWTKEQLIFITNAYLQRVKSINSAQGIFQKKFNLKKFSLKKVSEEGCE